ncbi:Ig-like domain-containing protein [Mobilitalea sibirica]|uniref:Ig-like domain-containing protein n=1 Tax=Mobilitalea sibirica TaxID=1462919 RepID=A0A8J7GY01_9FIRM|nr:Ig-like domain-containing protein [Mobilitalea sibirica]MBH1940239.1 Ig-like domain-containing protein [Mobilitalea sibirica]
MSKMRRYGLPIIIGLILSIAWFFSIDYNAKASQVTLPEEYFFVFNGQQKKAGTEYEMKSPEVLLNITAGEEWMPDATVSWVSSETGVVSLENTTYGSNFVKLVRKGPGYSTITAVISTGTSSYSLSCQVKVGLEFDSQKTGLITSTTTKERVLILENIDDEKQIYLKYLDYVPVDETETVSGAAISASLLSFTSDNEGVVTVDEETGKIKAVGSGSAEITVTTNTMSSNDRPMEITLRAVVKPTFRLAYDDASGTHHDIDSVGKENEVGPGIGVAQGVPSEFVIESNAMIGTNLKWEVRDLDGKKLSPDSDLINYTVSEISGNVTFTNVKAGTYKIYAFANEKFTTGTNAPYAYMMVVVPINIADRNLVMTVGDTYSVLENSNIPDVDIFNYYETDPNIASIDIETGEISANRKGQTTIQLTYKSVSNLYDNDVIVGTITLNITVIDGIALSLTNAHIYTSGTVLLQALVTDPTKEIRWFTSDDKIATVEGGLVTGLKPGIVTITAQQIINGVAKKATCRVTVQQSVETVTITPAEVTIPIDGLQTLHATITPKNLSGITLTWKSSNDNIVEILESTPLSATIRGVEGGHAVISAINQNNIVVGYTHVRIQQPVTSIVLSETNVTLDLAMKRVQLRATVYPENALNKTVHWRSTDESIARVDQNGLVTLLNPGSVSIIATSDDNPRLTATCNMTIEIPVVSVALDETEKTMYVGQSTRLTYLVLPSNASKNSVIWTSTNTSVATVDKTGKVTAKKPGTAVIILKTLDGGKSVYCTITVRQVATGIKFDVTELDLKTDEYYYIKAELSPKDSTDNDLLWESTDTKVAIVDAHGKVTAKEAGNALIMARTEAGAIAYAKVNVTLPVEGLLLNFSDKTIYVGDEFELKVSVSPSEASELGVTWESSNTRVATIDKNGVVEGLMGGTTVITAKTLDGGYSATCVVTVWEKVTSIQLDHSMYRLGVGKSFVINADVLSSSATNKKVTWESSNEKVATVNKNGKVTGVALGYAVITATAQDGSEVEASCEVEVVRQVTRLTLDKGYVSMFVGDNTELKATIKPSNATYNEAAWSSSDESVAVVDEDGVVLALKPGTATITAFAQDNSGKRAMTYVTVSNRIPSTGITVMDKKLVMVSGEDKVVRVTLSPVASTDGYSWSTDNVAVAQVDPKTGKITARATGTAMITVMTDSGKTATIEVTVVGLNFTELTLEQYTTYNYALSVEGATTPVTWSIDNPEIAVLRRMNNTSTTISSRGTGTATITATVNGRKLQCKIKVVKIS